jgi:hypothetical protein
MAPSLISIARLCLFAITSVVSHFFETEAESRFFSRIGSALDGRIHPAKMDQAKPSGSSGS